jgi:hypothetical protein
METQGCKRNRIEEEALDVDQAATIAAPAAKRFLAQEEVDHKLHSSRGKAAKHEI